MRKILLIILVVSIFSFSIVYAQEIYSADSNKQEEDELKSRFAAEDDRLAREVDQIKQRQQASLAKAQGNEDETPVSSGPGSGQALLEEKQSTIIHRTKNTNTNNNESKPAQDQKKSTKNTASKKEDPVKAEKGKKTSENKPKADGSPVIDTGNGNKGSFRVKYLSDKKLKVMVVKGKERYTYDLKGDNSYQSFPLQLGDGTYQLSIMENIGGKEYKYVLSKEFNMKTSNPNDKYLTSVQMIHWNKSMSAIKKAQSLAGGASDKQKVSNIYKFVVNNIRYDSSITSLPSGYVPSIDKTYSNKKGICYDFASLFAGMLRSVGVPAKLVKGESSNVTGYHAWNEVYVDGGWRIIDTSYDAQLKAAGHSVSMYKSGKDYSKSKQY